MLRWQERWQPPMREGPDVSQHMSNFQRWVVAIMCEHKESLKLASLIGQMEMAGDLTAHKAKQRLINQTVNMAERLHALETLARERGFDYLFKPSLRDDPEPIFQSRSTPE